jgi:pimeloyl-ACP methyl ester carboxylesterase
MTAVPTTSTGLAGAAEGGEHPPLFTHRVGSGAPLVLLHGLGESHVGWRPVIDGLAEDFDVIALDLPGFGRSPSLPGGVPPTAANLAAAVEATLDDLGADGYHVAGYSLGARVALQLGGSPRARSVIAMGPDGLGTPLERIQGFVGLAVGRGVALALAPAATPLSLTPVGRMAFFSGNRSRPWQLSPTDARQLLTGFAAAPAYDAVNWISMFEVPTTLHTIEAPVLFVQGTADPLTGQVLRYLPLIPHARLRLLPGSNHVPISDDPAGLVLHMKDFLAQIGS